MNHTSCASCQRVPLTAQVLETLKKHQQQMEQLGIYEPYGLVFVTPTSYRNVYDHLLGRVWRRSLQRCGLKPRRLYVQRHSFLSHALAMGNSPADLAAAAGHSTKMLLDTYVCQAHRQIEDAELADNLKLKINKDVMR